MLYRDIPYIIVGSAVRLPPGAYLPARILYRTAHYHGVIVRIAQAPIDENILGIHEVDHICLYTSREANAQIGVGHALAADRRAEIASGACQVQS